MKKRYFALLIALLMLALCACSQASVSGSLSDTTNSNQGLEDNIFNKETTGTDDDDKSFTASAPVQQGTVPVDTTDTTTDGNNDTTTDGKTDATDGKTDSTTGTTNGESAGPDTSMTYEEFEALSSTEKRLFQESFKDIDAFFDWYEAVKAEYEKENPPIIVDGTGSVTLPT